MVNRVQFKMHHSAKFHNVKKIKNASKIIRLDFMKY